MHIVEGISIGISAIRSNKLRSSLTMLGIIIGIAAVLAMIAIGDGAKTLVLDKNSEVFCLHWISILVSRYT